MNITTPLRTCYLLVFTLAFLYTKSFAQNTTIWVVRHAEKDTSILSRDPDLSWEGKQRAIDLATYFNKKKPDIIYSTNYKRTRQTASKLPMEIKNYNPQNLKELASEILSQYKGKTILIIGHSNTVLETLEVFGGKRPIPALTEDDYNYIFRLTIPENGNIKTDMFTYGKGKH